MTDIFILIFFGSPGPTDKMVRHRCSSFSAPYLALLSEGMAVAERKLLVPVGKYLRQLLDAEVILSELPYQ